MNDDTRRDLDLVDAPPSSGAGRGDEHPAFQRDRFAEAAARQGQPSPATPKLKTVGSIGALLALLLTKLKGVLALFVPLLKGLQAGKILFIFSKAFTTFGTMMLSMWFYAVRFGWAFAAGFVISILVHELGHVFMAWRKGVPVSAPIFIPGMGALILQKRAARSTWDEAVIGIGGPLAGTLAGLVCLALGIAYQSPLFVALAYTGFVINLFNLIPVFPLDGGWITQAVSPRLWGLGILGLSALFLTGTVHNPMILILVVLSLPRLWRGIRGGSAAFADVTPMQRTVMGASYLLLAGALSFLVMITHI